MRAIVTAFAVLLAVPAPAPCTPGDPNAIAAAERKAGDAEYRAEQAEAIAVKSGNPGAAARAKHARAQAVSAQAELAKLQCKDTTNAPAGRHQKGGT